MTKPINFIRQLRIPDSVVRKIHDWRARIKEDPKVAGTQECRDWIVYHSRALVGEYEEHLRELSHPKEKSAPLLKFHP